MAKICNKEQAVSIKCGTINYSCCSGLGILTKSFYDHGIVTDMFIVEHSRHPTEWQWYPQTTPHCPIRELDQNARELRRFVDGLDVLLCFETPFRWPIVDYAKSRGVKTVCMPMYECSLTNPPATFDEYWCPSLLDLEYFCDRPVLQVDKQLQVDPSLRPFQACYGIQGSVSRFTPVPVKVDWRQRTEAKVFVHNAGHGGLKGRNGTKELIESFQYVKSPIKLVIRSQENVIELRDTFKVDALRSPVEIEFITGTQPAESLYTDGDVFIFPEKFNGLSLPLQEARAAGMLVMATDRYPMNTWLPTVVETTTEENKEYRTHSSPLIPISGTVKNRIGPPYMEFDEAVINPKDIAAKIDEWYGRDISQYSLSGKEWAESMSWEKLGPKYLELLEGLK